MPGSLGEPHSRSLGPSVTAALRVGCPGYVTAWQVSAEAPAPGSSTSHPGQVGLGFLSSVLCALPSQCHLLTLHLGLAIVLQLCFAGVGGWLWVMVGRWISAALRERSDQELTLM